jgi:formylglycine-generating enzyme required for sulfatase activity
MTVAGGEDAELTEIDEYRIVRRLNSRAEGKMYLAHDRTLDRPVVLLCRPENLEVARGLFGRARRLVRVTHPSLWTVHRLKDEGRHRYAVLEHATGQRLDALPLPLPAHRVLEIGRGLAGAVAALHAHGISHGSIRAKRVIVTAEGVPRLFGAIGAPASAGSQAVVEDVRALAALLQDLADADLRGRIARLAGGRTLTAEGLFHALEGLARRAPGDDGVADNPYRGLETYEAKHAESFFGRSAQVANVLERLQGMPWLLVAAPAGCGKSSLVRAGIAPAVARGDLGERSRWDVVTVAPGLRPLSALADSIAPTLGRDATTMRERLVADASLAANLAGARTDSGLLLVVDPLDDVFSAADKFERSAFLDVLASFGRIMPGVRIILTLRSHLLQRLGELRVVGRDLLGATYMLPAMRDAELAEVVVGPLRTRDFAMEAPAMVDALVADVNGSPESLPVLSFALAELWKWRDAGRRVIPKAALEQLGGASHALARHGELVLAGLGRESRQEARRILVTLATESHAQDVFTREALVSGGNARAAHEALDALVASRLVAEGAACKLTHPHLARTWGRLRTWLDDASSAHAAKQRLEKAAREWERVGRPEDILWSARQLRDAETSAALGDAGATALAFVDASRHAVRRQEARRWTRRFALPVALALVAAGVAGIRSWHERRQNAAAIAASLTEAGAARAEACDLDAQLVTARREAFAHYDAKDWAGGETRWVDVLALSKRASSRFAAAASLASLALARDPRDARSRALAADISLSWLELAERDHEERLIRELSARVALLDDDGSRRARLSAPAHLRVTTSPPGANVSLHRVRVEGGRRVEDSGRAIGLDSRLELEPGSYVLDASARGLYPTRLPVRLVRADDQSVVIRMPSATEVPAGFVYVPEGVSLLGAPEVETVRQVTSAQPEHAVPVDGFFIAEHEVTFSEYIEFLTTLPPQERETRRPHSKSVDLMFAPDGSPMLTLERASAQRGEPLCRPKRSVRRCQDWLRMPIGAISWEDGVAYEAWLAAARVPGARLCTEREWERAARGADGRTFPWGDDLRPGDTNFEATYAFDGEQSGEDEVGSFPVDRSPFGVFDLAGNNTEWVLDTLDASRAAFHVMRGGAWLADEFGTHSASRITNGRHPDYVGLRSCASIPVP